MQSGFTRMLVFAALAALHVWAQPAIKVPGVLPAEHKLFSPAVAQSLGKLQINQAVTRQQLTLPPSVATARAFTLANQTAAAGILECSAGKASDKMTVEESEGHLVLSVGCQSAGLRTHDPRVVKQATVGSHTLWIGFRKQAVPLLFRPETGVGIRSASVLKARREAALVAAGGFTPAAPASKQQSKDEYEVDNCVKAFQTYKSDPQMNYFRVVFAARVYHCEVAKSAEAYAAHRQYLRSFNLTKLNVGGISPLSAPRLYFELNEGSPDQHPGLIYSFEQEGAVRYNSKPDPNAVQRPGTKPLDLSASQVVTLAFGADRQPEWGGVMVQVASGAAPPSNQRVEVTSAQRRDPCGNWQSPPNLLWSRVAGPTFRPTVVEQTALDRYKLTGEVAVSQAQLANLATKQANGAAETLLYARIVPLADGRTCAAAPSNWVVLHMHDNYPAEKADFDRRTAENAQKQAIGGADGKLGAPLTVSISGYVGYNLDQPDSPFMAPLPMAISDYVVSTDNLNAWGIKHSGGPWQACSYSVADVTAWHQTDHSNLDSWLEKAWDGIILAVDGTGEMFSAMETSLAEFIVYPLSGGKCPIDDPTGTTGPASGESTGCLNAKLYTKTAIQVVLAVMGVASSAPTAAQLVSQGAQAAAAEAAAEFEAYSAADLAEVGGSIGVQAAVNAVADQVIDKLAQAAASKLSEMIGCSDPDASAALWPHSDLEQQYSAAMRDPTKFAAKDQLDKQFDAIAKTDPAFAAADAKYPRGFYGFNDHHCVVQESMPDTWGMWNPAVLPSPGIVFLKVARNPSPQAAQTAKLTGNRSMNIYVSDNSGWYNDTVVALDVSHIPAAGAVVPVTLSPNIEKYRMQAQVGLSDNPAVYDVDLEQSLWIANRNKPGVKAEIWVSGSYAWTDKPTYISGNQRVQVGWASQSFDINSIWNVPLPASAPPCRYCDQGDGSARACNQ
jgi:hypothetical protein